MREDAEMVVLMNKMLMTFLAVLTVGMLSLGTAVSATGPEHNETVLLLGTGVNPLAVENPTGITVATQRTYNGITITSGQSVNVDLTWEDVVLGSTQLSSQSVNRFTYQVLVNDVPIDTKTLLRSNTEGLHLTYTDVGTYKVVLTGTQGATKYSIAVDELP